MKMGKPRKRSPIKLLVFIAVFALVFFGVQYFTKTGIFKVPGVVYYDESLTEAETETLKKIFTEEVVLDQDVTISAKNYLERPELEEHELLYQIYVPVAEFYSSENNLKTENADALLENDKLINIDDLTFKQKLLSLNDKYFLKDFNSGAVFRTIKFDSKKYDDEIKPLIESEFIKEFPDKSNVLSFAQTGVTALSRKMNAKLNAIGGDATYFAENIKEYLSNFDLTHTSNESSFTDSATSENICSNPVFIDTLTAIGLDIVELTGNHNVDCGTTAAEKTIDLYNEKNIKIVGGGKNAEEAAKPLNLSDKGTNITFLAYNESTGGATTGNTPGANQYDEENAKNEISAAKSRGDIVIVDIQYYECSAYASEYEDPICDYADSSAGDQIGFFRHLINLGADIVVGTSAHQPQTFEQYKDGEIYYGLGNLFFDQIDWPGTTRSLVLEHYFYKGKLLQTKVTPTVYDRNMQTRVMENPQWFLERLIKVKP